MATLCSGSSGGSSRFSCQRVARARRTTAPRAVLSEEHAHELRARGELSLARAEAQRAETGRQAAERAASTAHRMRLRDAVAEESPPQLTSRELEVLTLASLRMQLRRDR
jgi:DNA-binding NarL/FixJ family response regulator